MSSLRYSGPEKDPVTVSERIQCSGSFHTHVTFSNKGIEGLFETFSPTGLAALLISVWCR